MKDTELILIYAKIRLNIFWKIIFLLLIDCILLFPFTLLHLAFIKLFYGSPLLSNESCLIIVYFGTIANDLIVDLSVAVIYRHICKGAFLYDVF